MEIKEALNLMNSDFKLWEKADTKDLGGGKIAKTLDLPWGIGEYTVELEGMNDSNKRRAAVGAYGEHIRGIIKERTDDEIVTSRAKAAAARAEFADSTDSDSLGTDEGLRDESVPTEAVQAAGEAYQEDVTKPVILGADFPAERAAIESRIERLEAELTSARRDLRVINAVIAAMDEES